MRLNCASGHNRIAKVRSQKYIAYFNSEERKRAREKKRERTGSN